MQGPPEVLPTSSVEAPGTPMAVHLGRVAVVMDTEREPRDTEQEAVDSTEAPPGVAGVLWQSGVAGSHPYFQVV